MSSMYYKVTPAAKPVPVYGFKKVSAKELSDITERLVRTTYNRQLSTTDEQRQVHNYEYLREQALWRRTPSACVRRSSAPASRCSSAKRMSDKEMKRLLRRLMKPTKSVVNAQADVGEKNQDEKLGRIVRTKDLDERTTKSVMRLSRPTTASRAKSATCHLCYEHENKSQSDPLDAFDYDYMDDRLVPEEEMHYIVGRMMAPTCVSAGSHKKCAKTPVYVDEVKIRQNLPLVSGLDRSRNVNEIVDRLYPKPRYRMTPMATPVTVY
ncbi:hypothetical protein KUTeg_009949 [Tegillarca granosa]|uniref:Uncharacterized protein n=1 Tax=Tegillarca granosa TaxID=220873 RepID=A0ABQ9F5C9_TEGGR|nr:hypothetical protein KUTeg_009949 [Tegillarca granosa]